MTSPAREFTTRPLTGLPSWPVICEAGVQKGGKTFAAVEASASDLIGRTFMVTLGETDPDEYGLIPGQRVELVEHGGTYRDVLDALRWAVAQPWPDDAHPNLVILDGGSRLWELLTDMAQEGTYAALRAKAQRQGKSAPPPMSEEQKITPDQWNIAASRWGHVMDVLINDHQGPSIITARLDQVMVMDGNGNPTKEKVWKVQAHKSLVFDVDGIIELREQAIPGRPAPATLRGLRSMRFQGESAEFPEGLPIDRLWRLMGLEEGWGKRRHKTPDTLRSMQQEEAQDARVAQDRAAEGPARQVERPAQQERLAPPQQQSTPTPTPAQAAQKIAERLEQANSDADVLGIWQKGAAWVMSMPWWAGSGCATMEDYANRAGVQWRGRHVRLMEVAESRRWEHQNGAGGGASAPQEPPAGPSGDDGTPEPSEPPQDDVPPPWDPDPRGTEDDPWAQGQAPGTADDAVGAEYPTEHGSVENLLHGLGDGAQVVDDGAPVTPAGRVQAQHEDDLARKREARAAAAAEAADDQRGAVGGTPGKPANTGKVSAAVRAKAHEDAERVRKEQEAAAATPTAAAAAARSGRGRTTQKDQQA